jgi:glycerol-3-phosphate dehydrogenase
MKTYDYLIVGGGIFGVYASIYLARKKLKVCLVEKERELLTKASIVNQARLHSGYHYPRSIATARIALDHKERFIQDHKPFINFSFKQYYAIDKYSSFTDSRQFERFCDYLNIKAERVKEHDLFDFSRIEELYLTDEYSFDPVLIAEHYRELLKNEKNVTVMIHSLVVAADKGNSVWKVRIADREENTESSITAGSVINATYAGTNTINGIFNIKKIKLMHEISEIVFISSPPLQDVGLTIMDGNFCSIMPYGLSNLLCLTSVVYSHQKVSYSDEPVFDCQKINRECRPDCISVCDSCEARPESNQYKMICHMRNYIAGSVRLDYMFSMFTVKSKLQASYIDDGRPTVITKLDSNPDYYCLFAGKINSIYEIERVLQERM